jgi:peroxiredoxin
MRSPDAYNYFMAFKSRAAGSLAAFFLGLAMLQAAEAAEVVGEMAPEFALRELGGGYVSVTALRGHVVLLNFWATWCPPCRDEMPALDSLYDTYSGRGLRVLAVASDSSERSIKEFFETTAVSYTVIRDAGSRVQRLYGAYSIPTTFLIDRRGVVVKKYTGPQEWLSTGITGLLEDLLRTGGEVGPEIPAAREIPPFEFPARD